VASWGVQPGLRRRISYVRHDPEAKGLVPALVPELCWVCRSAPATPSFEPRVIHFGKVGSGGEASGVSVVRETSATPSAAEALRRSASSVARGKPSR